MSLFLLGWGCGCRRQGAHSLSLLHTNAGFIFFRCLWFQRLICSDADGLYLQFLMANGTPDTSSGALAPVGVLIGQTMLGL